MGISDAPTREVSVVGVFFLFFFFNDTATTEIYTLSLHDALPISLRNSPSFHRDHSSRFCSCLNPGRPLCAIRPPPDRCRTILGVAPTGRNQGRFPCDRRDH